MNPSEHSIQSAFVQWVGLKAQADSRLLNVFAVPNAAKRSPFIAGRMLKEGLKKGVPDIIGMVPVKGFHGFAIEFKRRGGKLRPEQYEWLMRLKDSGYAVLVAFDLDTAIQFVEKYLNR